MKKLMTLCFIAAAMLVACNKKAAPGVGANGSNGSSGNNSKEATANKANIEQSSATEKAATEAMKTADKKADEPVNNPATPAMPVLPNKPSEEESGRLVFNSKCTTCHAAKSVGAYTFNQWEGILKSMVPKAKLSADEENQVVAYIKAHSK